MTGTYRLQLLYVKDGDVNWSGNNARKARAKIKNIDRRIKRREHDRIIREAVHRFYEDQTIDLYDQMLVYLDDDYTDYGEYIHDDDYQDDYHDHDYYDPIDYDDYNYMDEWYFPRREEPEDRILKAEDVGKTLAEVLQEIENRRYT